MFTIQNPIVSRTIRLFVICSLPLCLAFPALDSAASPAGLTAQVNDLPLGPGSTMVDPPEIFIPKPPPPSVTNLIAQANGLLLGPGSTMVDPPEIFIPKPPPPSTATEQAA